MKKWIASRLPSECVLELHDGASLQEELLANNRFNDHRMHLMYVLDKNGKRVYTLKKVLNGEVTKSAHPARFSPDDKYSRHRVTMKKRYGLLLTQQPGKELMF
ncbi:hypothetical protein KEM56_000797 [Ascosphaera pollenicola]|nr:hypothetical protein KEM56_000797 [Ascosphaera pollenicola]